MLAPTVIEPHCRSSDDNTYESNTENEIRNNSSISVHETSVHETSIINTSMEAQLGDTVSLSMELRNSSQEVTSSESMCEAISQDVVYYMSSTELNPPNSSQDITPVQSTGEPVSQNVLPMPLDNSQDVTANQNTSEPALQDVTTCISHDKTSSANIRPNIGHNTAQTTSDSNRETDKSSQEITHLPQSIGDSALEMDTSENSPGKTHDGTESSASSESVITVTTSKALKAKERLSSIGLSEVVYHANVSMYYPLVSADDDLDFINFADIVNSNCSVSLDNLSMDDVRFEQKQLKCSSPMPSDKEEKETETSTTSVPSDNEKLHPSYGTSKQGKPSYRPRRKPSSKRIAAQRIINKTRQKRGVKTDNKDFFPCKPSQSCEHKRTNIGVSGGKTSVNKSTRNSQTTVSDKPKSAQRKGEKSGVSGLKIVHHGLKRLTPRSKGRHCQCDMCGENYNNTTAFIAHYSSTHPPLPCKDCNKIFNNPLSLQKHRYHHVGKQYPCDVCNRTFPFDSQLRDH